MKTGVSLTLERFARFEFGFLGRTHAMCVRAAGVRAVEKEQRLEREARTRRKKDARPYFREERTSYWTP